MSKDIASDLLSKIFCDRSLPLSREFTLSDLISRHHSFLSLLEHAGFEFVPMDEISDLFVFLAASSIAFGSYQSGKVFIRFGSVRGNHCMPYGTMRR
jgi:hypothetical protein